MEEKKRSRVNDKDISGLRAFLKAAPECKAAILAYNGFEAVKIDKKVWAIPLSLLLS